MGEVGRVVDWNVKVNGEKSALRGLQEDGRVGKENDIGGTSRMDMEVSLVTPTTGETEKASTSSIVSLEIINKLYIRVHGIWCHGRFGDRLIKICILKMKAGLF